MAIQLSSPRLCIRFQGTTYYRPLTEGSFWTIGRSKDNNIVLADQCVSRRHAILQVTDDNDFYFIDMGSRNGSLVNGQRTALPTRLQHGDRLLLGKTELEFQFPLPEIRQAGPESIAGAKVQPASTPRVLMVQPIKKQGLIWQRLLKDCGIQVLWESEVMAAARIIDRLQSNQPLPDLLLLDISVLQPNPFIFARWCREKYPALKLILTNSSRNEIYPSERRWAQQQGATELLTGFPEKNLRLNALEIIQKLNCVIQALQVQAMPQQSLFSTLQALETELS